LASVSYCLSLVYLLLFFFNAPAPSGIYTLSLHDALPICGGNPNVVLCERGIKTFESELRNTFDLAAIALAKELSHLPVVADPSHGTGRRSVIPAMSRAAIAAGADGIMVEVHPCPERALSDGPQSLDLKAFAQLMEELDRP